MSYELYAKEIAKFSGVSPYIVGEILRLSEMYKILYHGIKNKEL